MQDVEGKELQFSAENLHKPTILHFWAEFCPICVNAYSFPCYYDTTLEAALLFEIGHLPYTVVISADGQILENTTAHQILSI